MGRARGSCGCCSHPRKAEIDLALLHGGSIRQVAAQFGFRDWSVVHRHKQKHLPNVIAQAELQTEARVREELQPNVQQVMDTLWRIYRKMCSTCRRESLAEIEAMEQGHESDIGVENADGATRSRPVDRPAHQEERTQSTLRVVPPSA
jgi:hypothetical protein